MRPVDGEAIRRRSVFQVEAVEQMPRLWFKAAIAMAVLVAAPQHQLEWAARFARRQQVR
jgi:hypothetical protein